MSSTKSLLTDENVVVQEQRWRKAIKRLKRVFPLWGYHVDRLQLTMCRGWNRTAAVDGIHLFWNPEFTASLNLRQLTFLVAHEVFHVAAGHLWRGVKIIKATGGDLVSRNFRRANIAEDYAIHQILVPLLDTGGVYRFMQWIKCGLYDSKFTGRSMETIYRYLLHNPDQDPDCVLDLHILRGEGDAPAGSIVGKDGEWVLIVDANGDPVTPDENDPAPIPVKVGDLQREIKDSIKNAQGGHGHNRTGNQDSSATINTNNIKTSQDWKDILKRFLVDTARSDYSYSRPHRGYLSRGMIVPGLRSGLVQVKIAIDTSSSIDMTQLQRFGAEVESARDQIGDHEFEMITCSTEIPRDHKTGQEITQHVQTGDPVNWTFPIGGGTNFIPVFDYIERNGETPACLVYFTDGDGTYPPVPPQYPVLWVLYGDDVVTPPWGEIINLNKK